MRGFVRLGRTRRRRPPPPRQPRWGEAEAVKLGSDRNRCELDELPSPSESLWDRLEQRIAEEGGSDSRVALPSRPLPEPEWDEVALGISCELVATDREGGRVSMLVRLASGAEYPPHRHAGIEELFLLYGELWIGDRKLHAGDYNRAHAGTVDRRVWSESGCTCLLITSLRDAILDAEHGGFDDCKDQPT